MAGRGRRARRGRAVSRARPDRDRGRLPVGPVPRRLDDGARRRHRRGRPGAALRGAGGREGRLRRAPSRRRSAVSARRRRLRPAASTRPPRWRGAVQWLARLAVLGTLLLAVLHAIAYSVEAMSTWWLELLQYVPYPAYLLPAVAAFVLSFALSGIWRVAAAFGVLLVAT